LYQHENKRCQKLKNRLFLETVKIRQKSAVPNKIFKRGFLT